MIDLHDWTYSKARDPQCFVNTRGSQMTSHDWYLLSFFRTCCTKNTRWSTSLHLCMKGLLLTCIWKSRPDTDSSNRCGFQHLIFCLISALCVVTLWRQVNGSRLYDVPVVVLWVQLSIFHFPLFISIFCLASICSSIDLSITDCPPLVRKLVTCGLECV